MPSFRAAPVRVRVPATSANLGPAFDCAGLALSLYDDVVVRVADSGLAVDIAGEGSDDLPRDKRHLVVKALRAGFDRLGGQPRGLELVCANRIPQSRGLGSSSAAIVAALLAARALVLGGDDLLDDEAVLALATEIEGHPDNVAACLRGGLTLAWSEVASGSASGSGASSASRSASGSGSAVRVLRVDVHRSLAPVAFVPSTRASTRKVRGLLPDTVPHADAAASAGRAALLVQALTREPALLHAATEDRLHQDYRRSAMPRSHGLVTALRADGVAAVISGAGPTVLALVRSGEVEAVAARAPRGFEALPLAVDAAGAQVLPLSS